MFVLLLFCLVEICDTGQRFYSVEIRDAGQRFYLTVYTKCGILKTVFYVAADGVRCIHFIFTGGD